MVNDKTAVQPGDLVRDLVTGFEGICISRNLWLHGCDRISIQPNKLGTDKQPIKEQTFDEARIEIVKKAKVKATFPSDATVQGFPLGAEAKDSMTGFSGIISGLVFQISGELHVIIEPEKLDKEGKPRDIEAFHSSRIEVTKPKAIPQTTATTTEKKGGPPPRGEGARVR